MRFILAGFCLILFIVWIKRKEIADHKMTQKKMEIFKAIFENELDSAKLILEEAIDSSFYVK